MTSQRSLIFDYAIDISEKFEILDMKKTRLNWVSFSLVEMTKHGNNDAIESRIYAEHVSEHKSYIAFIILNS